MTTTTKTRRVAVKLTDAECAALHAKAHEAGLQAAGEATPRPVAIYTPKDPFGADTGQSWLQQADLSQPVYVENEGLCGFGWVEVRPVTGGIGKWYRKHEREYGYYSDYQRCFCVRSPLRTQSYERNLAYARGYAEVLKAAGIDAYGTGRLD